MLEDNDQTSATLTLYKPLKNKQVSQRFMLKQIRSPIYAKRQRRYQTAHSIEIDITFTKNMHVQITRDNFNTNALTVDSSEMAAAVMFHRSDSRGHVCDKRVSITVAIRLTTNDTTMWSKRKATEAIGLPVDCQQLVCCQAVRISESESTPNR
jgi:hypothetical protein